MGDDKEGDASRDLGGDEDTEECDDVKNLLDDADDDTLDDGETTSQDTLVTDFEVINQKLLISVCK